MKVSEVIINLMVEGAAYWNPSTLEVILYDPDYDEGPERMDRVDYPTLCLARVDFASHEDWYDDFWNYVGDDDDIERTEGIGRIVNEDGWVLVHETEHVFYEMLNEYLRGMHE